MPLLTTKLHIPEPSTNTVWRSRLLKQLDQGLSGKLTLVAAPAGFGKTTLLGCWLQDIVLIYAWVSLDEADNDEAIFWAYVLRALQQAWERDYQTLLASIDPEDLPPTKIFLTNLINELAANQHETILILDDYHVISNPVIHQQIGFLLENLPTQFHIILSTRADPPLQLARLRVKSQLCELRTDDLRFTPSETTIYLNDILELKLDNADIAALEARTEGWAAGLQLASLSMQGIRDKSAFIADFFRQSPFYIGISH